MPSGSPMRNSGWGVGPLYSMPSGDRLVVGHRDPPPRPPELAVLEVAEGVGGEQAVPLQECAQQDRGPGCVRATTPRSAVDRDGGHQDSGRPPAGCGIGGHVAAAASGAGSGGRAGRPAPRSPWTSGATSAAATAAAIAGPNGARSTPSLGDDRRDQWPRASGPGAGSGSGSPGRDPRPGGAQDGARAALLDRRGVAVGAWPGPVRSSARRRGTARRPRAPPAPAGTTRRWRSRRRSPRRGPPRPAPRPPRRRRCTRAPPASVTTACGTPAWRSSHAATREPSNSGRVSATSACTGRPAWWSVRITDSAVPNWPPPIAPLLPDRQQVDRLRRASPGMAATACADEGAVLRLRLDQDRLRLVADRGGHRVAGRLEAELLQERQLPVQRRAPGPPSRAG